MPRKRLPTGFSVPAYKVVWTVHNVGTDAALATNWYDSLWLSTSESGNNAVHLGNFLIDVDPTNANGLPAGGQYTMSATVRLPLSDAYNAGNYYFQVRVDNYQYFGSTYSHQPENNESNNALSSTAVPAVVPPLPDLTVSDITAPAVVEANKAFTVSWIVHPR